MKTKITSLLALLVGALAFYSCDTDIESEAIQKLKTYDEQYYKNLREYKKSDHAVFFGYYAAYAPIEGVEGYKDPASWGERFIGLPDSLDIVNLWMGIPSNDPSEVNYMPIAYQDMRHCQQVKGTRFVSHTDASWHTEFTYNGKKWDLNVDGEEGLKAYAESIVADILKYDIDGTDIDYEPRGYWGDGGVRFEILCKYLGELIGPKGIHSDKLFIIDYYSERPPRSSGELVNYYVQQCYGFGSASRLQSAYAAVNWIEPSKYICCETFGDYYENGGVAFTEADGNTITSPLWSDPVGKGTRMYSMEGMARWNPTQGRKGGFGAFYFDRDYYSKTGVPYYNVRRGIQLCNPSIKE